MRPATLAMTTMAGLLLALATCFATDSFWRTVRWPTDDGVEMVGSYHAPSRSNAWTWILLHGLGSTQWEWDVFARRLSKQGDGIFLYDMRGHGESNRTQGGLPLDYHLWRSAGPGSPWGAMPSDMSSAVRMLQERFNLSSKSLAVGGASLGANVALVYAAHHPGVPAVLLLSPGLEYAGIAAGPAYETYRGRPILMAASPDDGYAYGSMRAMADGTLDPARTMLEGKTGHGVKMLDEEFMQKVLKWMKKVEK
jgi:pimeloyl-ACP methyl ester carboxylesterase